MVVPPRDRRTTAGWWAIGFHVLAFVLICISMFTTYWLQAENKAYGTAVESVGLWTQCFRSYTTREDVHKERFFVGCRWIFDPFTTGYEDVQADLQSRESFTFFVTVQVFYTFCFTLSLLGAGLTGVLILCPGEDFEKYVLKLAYIDLFISWFFGFIAVIIFGAMGDNRDWMPHWDHNHLSWSFGLAVVGVVAEFVAAVLFWVEYRIQKRKESYRQSHGVFTLEGGTKN
ncbi:uncharacterized protein LOC119594605 [Penaeus monodon]|uniref:uncharacterized protein LOC119594605 n=1 Tax=Penaeus monodon TaxID=6687 RepID=UPI0018A6E608|nr:uncharacterized protein LOC119594605 [Penaeus monodon]